MWFDGYVLGGDAAPCRPFYVLEACLHRVNLEALGRLQGAPAPLKCYPFLKHEAAVETVFKRFVSHMELLIG